MPGNLKHYTVYFALVLLISAISFNGTFNSQTLLIRPTQDTITLAANPGPSNNGGSAGWAMFFDLIAGSRSVTITRMSTGSTATASTSFSVQVYTRIGTSLGGPVGSGPGSSTAGWTLLNTVPVVQGSTTNGISLLFDLPPILVPAGDTIGVALQFVGAGPRYYGTGTPPYSVYSDTNLALVTGDGRSAPFTPTGSWFASRALTGVICYYVNSISEAGNINTEIPKDFKLAQNYPNPFNPTTNIKYQIPKISFVSLIIYNIIGKEVAVLVNKTQSPGTYVVNWNGSEYSSGVYFYKIETKDFTKVMRMVMIK